MRSSLQKELEETKYALRRAENETKYLLKELREARQLAAAYKTIALAATQTKQACKCLMCCDDGPQQGHPGND